VGALEEWVRRVSERVAAEALEYKEELERLGEAVSRVASMVNSFRDERMRGVAFMTAISYLLDLVELPLTTAVGALEVAKSLKILKANAAAVPAFLRSMSIILEGAGEG
jgi:hypothetical protein